MAILMSTVEIASALVWLERTYPDLCQRIELPEPTHEKRTCHAIRIAKGNSTQRPAVLIIAGVHAREWGGPDIVVNFVVDLLKAYRAGKGLRYGAKSFEAGEIRWILETLSLVVFPCVNPDGVEFSHKRSAYWRKNRNPKSFDGNPASVGVDINRNYDFLWDFRRYFHPEALKNSSLASDDPKLETFHGLSPFSEPETRNVRWLMDALPGLSLFLDLHCYSGSVFHSWGDDQDQSSDPEKNFRNPAYDGLRGVKDDGYCEYLSPPDKAICQSVAHDVASAMRAVRQRPYKAEPGYNLYATSGTSDDYAFSRHLCLPGRSKVFAYTLEFNFASDAPDDEPFIIAGDPAILDSTMRDVIPGLMALCLAASLTGCLEPQRLACAEQPTRRFGVDPATGQVSYVTGGGARHAPALPDPHTNPTARDLAKLLFAFDVACTIKSQEGEAVRTSILQQIEKIAAAARKQHV